MMMIAKNIFFEIWEIGANPLLIRILIAAQNRILTKPYFKNAKC